MRILIVSILIFLVSFKTESRTIFDFEKNTEGWESVISAQELKVSPHYARSGENSLCLEVKSAKEAWIRVSGNFDFSQIKKISFYIYLPEEAEAGINFKCYMKDREYNWFETKIFSLRRGEERKITLNLCESDYQWQPVSNLKTLNGYTKKEIKEFGIKFFFPLPFTGKIYLDDFETFERMCKSIYLSNFRINSEKIEKYQKFEITFSFPITFQNPFDPGIIEIDGVFKSPSGKIITIPAFIYQDYIRYLDKDGENLYPYGSPEWKIRFTPEEEGEYAYSITMKWKGKNYKFDCGKFKVIKGKRKGFIRWDCEDKNYLSFSDGEFFYPIGHTLRSPDDVRKPYPYRFTPPQNEGTFGYDRYFRKMAENRENYARIWMAAWWVGIEWNPSYAPHYKGLGRYSLLNSWRLDYLLDTAEKYGIYIDLTLINHGQFSIRPDAEWWDNPYNITNGGFLSSPDEFFVNEKAIDYFKKRLRYIVARWGYSPNIVFWELWNEVDLTGYYDTSKIRKWHREIYPYLKSIDPYKHPITTHYCRHQADPLVWIIPELEAIVGNSYGVDVVNIMKNFYVKRKPFEKPIMINEFGVGRNKELLENNLHAGIWASSMMPMFGVALFWWWPFIDHYDLYYHYNNLSKFWKGIDRRGKNFQISECSIQPQNKFPSIGTVGMQNEEEGYFWIYDKRIYESRILRKPRKIADLKIRVRYFIPGKYRIEFWDTYRGEIILSEEKEFKDFENLISIPAFEKDIALKIKRIK